MKKLVKKKTVKLSTLKKKAWDQFSRYIRLRDCIATTGTTEYGLCVSCQRRLQYQEGQAGHYTPGRTGSVLFHEDLVHFQCRRCNIFLDGNISAYAVFMYSRYTLEQMEAFELLRSQTLPLKKHDYERIAQEYKERGDALLKL